MGRKDCDMYQPAPGVEDCDGLRQQVVEACLSLLDKGLFIGTWGNVSVRLAEGMLVTPTRVAYPDLRPEDLVVVDWDGQVVRGERKATSEAPTHRLLMLRRADFGAVIHFHSTHLMAAAAAHASVPVCAEEMAHMLGDEIRCTSHRAGETPEDVGVAAAGTIGERAMGLLLANHGPVVAGRDLAEAALAAEVMEKSAAVYATASAFGGAVAMPDEEVQRQRQRFLYAYGK